MLSSATRSSATSSQLPSDEASNVSLPSMSASVSTTDAPVALAMRLQRKAGGRAGLLRRRDERHSWPVGQLSWLAPGCPAAGPGARRRHRNGAAAGGPSLACSQCPGLLPPSAAAAAAAGAGPPGHPAPCKGP
jgi:hypothetical protein